MRSKILKITIGLIILLISVILFLPYGIYYLGLSNTENYPEAPINAIHDNERKIELWRKFKGASSPELKQISPWDYLNLIKCSVEQKKCIEYPGLQHATYVARNHVLASRKSKSELMWHVSGAAYTIWISNNWSIDQVLSRVDEIESQNSFKK